MAVMYGYKLISRARQPLLDLLSLNISLILGVLLRFGITLENAPDYSRLQWASIFVVYSALYMSTFFFIGLYHRYRNSPERALMGIFGGCLFNVFIVNFIKEYNFSRIASFYCWGLNSILISGWRFLYRIRADETEVGRRQAVIVGKVADAAFLKRIIAGSDAYPYDILGCVEVTDDAIRGRETEGVRVLGLIGELGDIIREYSVNVVIMVGSSIPYSKILHYDGKLGLLRPEFKLVPELICDEAVKEGTVETITMIDISPGGMVGDSKN